MTGATSASDRYEGVRKALEAYERETDPNGYDGTPDDVVDALATALRALAELPAIEETVEEIAERVLYRESGTDIRNIVAQAVLAGIQAAWEDWEPENAPGTIVTTREQYNAVCAVVDAAKMDDRSEDTDVYAGRILDALGMTL